MTMLPSGVPSLDSLSEGWVDAADLPHLHSLRNQWGQAHVNADLTSLSWLAIPPFSGGYHTGVLRIDGVLPAADSFNWAPWGVKRRALVDGISVTTDTRLGYESTEVLWRISATNETAALREVEVQAELLAPIAHTDVDWGWLYGTPWNEGHRHDFHATERLRTEVVAPEPRQVQLTSDDPRNVRLGRPRVPGIQRDEEDAPMLMETALPSHFSVDSPSRRRPDAAIADFTWVEVADAAGDVVRMDGPWVIADSMQERRLAAATLGDGGRFSFEVIRRDDADGVLITHGNHPDSLQFEIRDGRLFAQVGGEPLLSDRRLEPGVAYCVSALVSNDGAVLEVDGVEVGRTSPWWAGTRWSALVHEDAVVVRDSASPARSAFAFSRPPHRIDVDGQRAIATWKLVLEPGQTGEVGMVLSTSTDSGESVWTATRIAGTFDGSLDAVAESWRSLWADAFTPGNAEHSGYLPVFTSPDNGLELAYYYGILLAVYMRNTGVSSLGPVFLTGGPRLGATTTFYWDQSEWARVGAMLEPHGVRAWILAALSQPYKHSHSFDTRSLTPVGNHYASNDHALFTIIEHYVGITGDESVLDEVAAGRTVIDHLREMTGRVTTQRVEFGGETLVDLGRDAWELLECVPNYRDAVVSFNAGYAGMTASLAALLDMRGDLDEARSLREESERLTSAVLAQYDGAGRWRISHPEGDEPIGHCLDFELVSAHLAERLDSTQREEMVAFVQEHLLDGNWMRALSPDDPIAPFSDRPDHGAAGAFAGWPGATSYGLARLGRADVAAAFLSRIHLSRSGALWGQAVEAIGNGQFQVAERGVSNRDSNAAVAPSEAVIAGLFGIRAGFTHAGSGALVSDWGTLRNVRAVGFDLAMPSRRAVIPDTVSERG